MEFAQPLIPGRLVQRYKRFLADVDLADGRRVTAHCPNPGSMMGLAEPGLRVWLEPNADPRRKLGHAWRLVDLPSGAMAGIDTAVPNRIVAEALAAGRIPDLAGYAEILPERRYGARSRVDFLLRGPGRPDAYVEVKNVHLMRRDGLAEFPDCVTARGTKHLADLAAEVARGHRAVMLYVVQRDDCDRFALADDLDPAYARGFAAATAEGVEALVYRATLSVNRIMLDSAIPMVLPAGQGS